MSGNLFILTFAVGLAYGAGIAMGVRYLFAVARSGTIANSRQETVPVRVEVESAEISVSIVGYAQRPSGGAPWPTRPLLDQVQRLGAKDSKELGRLP